MQTPTEPGLPTYLPPDPDGPLRARSSSRPARLRHATRPRSSPLRFRTRYVPQAGFGTARVYAGGGPPAGVDFIDRAYGVFLWLVLGVLALTYLCSCARSARCSCRSRP